MDKKEKIVVIAKAVTMLVAGVACATVVGAVTKNIVPLENLSKYNKAMIILGTGIFGGIAADAGGNYAADMFKAVETAFDEIGKAFEKPEKGQ